MWNTLHKQDNNTHEANERYIYIYRKDKYICREYYIKIKQHT